jgi:hypothetical protein
MIGKRKKICERKILMNSSLFQQKNDDKQISEVSHGEGQI